MIKCPKCGITNDEDSFYCKRCGFPLDEDPKAYNQNSNTKTKQKHGKTKTKNKSKVKTKVKYKDNDKQKGQMSFFQSFMMFFFILLSICALGAAGFLAYYVYQNSNIPVPNVEGYSYEDAESTLKEAKLQSQMVQKTVTDEDEVGIVISQNKKPGSKVMENTVIKLTVGVLDTKVTVPDVEGLSLDEATKLLNKNNVKYEIKYETSDEEDNTVLSQSIKAGKKIDNTNTVIITVAQNDETQNSENKVNEDESIEENDLPNEDDSSNDQNMS